MTLLVNVDNFRAAETARMFGNLLRMSGGVNRWSHNRAPTPVDQQPVIRMNRDTLYSVAVVDLAEGASLTVPDGGGRYVSVMVVNGEHYIHRVYREPGTYEVSMAEHGTPYVAIAARVFVDPDDPADVAAANALQDRLVVEARSARPYDPPAYDPETLDATRDALLALGRGVHDTTHMFGRPDEVEATRHLIGTAAGWGGLPESEAYYYLETEPREPGRYVLTLDRVPVDAFWSITVYNRDGFFEPNPYGTYNVNSVTAEPEPDGSVVVDLAPEPTRGRNHIYTPEGWNYALRLYRPRPEILDGRWTPPEPAPAA